MKKVEKKESPSSSLGWKRAEVDHDDDDDVLVKIFRNILNMYDNESEYSEVKELMFYCKVCSVCRAWRVACEKALVSRLLPGDSRYDWEELLEDELDDDEEEEEDDDEEKEEESSDYGPDEEED